MRQHDAHIIDDDGKEIGVIHACEGVADEQITLEEIKACTKYFGTRIQQIWPGQEYNMAFYLAMHKEAAQRGGKLDVSMLDTIPIMSKWCTREALTYFFKEVNNV